MIDTLLQLLRPVKAKPEDKAAAVMAELHKRGLRGQAIPYKPRKLKCSN